MQFQDVQKAAGKRSFPGDGDGDSASVTVRVRFQHFALSLLFPWSREVAVVAEVATYRRHSFVLCRDLFSRTLPSLIGPLAIRARHSRRLEAFG